MSAAVFVTQAGADAEASILATATEMLTDALNLHAKQPAPPRARALLKSRVATQFPGALSDEEWASDHCLWLSLSVPMRRFVLKLVRDMTGLTVRDAAM